MESVFIFCLLQTGFSSDFGLGCRDLHLYRNEKNSIIRSGLQLVFVLLLILSCIWITGSFYLAGPKENKEKQSTTACLIFTVVFVCLNLANSKFPLPTSLSLSISVGGGGPSAVVNTNSEQEHMWAILNPANLLQKCKKGTKNRKEGRIEKHELPHPQPLPGTE